ncbi:MAG: YifB family Mg chelatase-like AAA ATPase [Proteobacteria bacterium]|nr:YifB family Mg chelatase-like AAA ATPase [Pseudomonadota bacterium]
MVARVKTVAFQGIDATEIDVQVHLSSGLPAFHIVGLPDKAVAESRERVRAALHAIGLALPTKRITVNLSPADIQKEGSHYDLPIALGLLASMDVLPKDALTSYIALGELALDGLLCPVPGVLPTALHASSQGFGLICPHASAREAAWASDIALLAPQSLLALVNHFKGTQVLTPPEPALATSPPPLLDLADVKGQESAKRALEIAAAGGHNLLMLGPPGSGKSMLAARLPGILPMLSPEEALEVTMIHSLFGLVPSDGLVRVRPFRDPHHSASLPALVGGGARAKPGEVSLSHHGVLFLDELPEFSRSALEAMRAPLECGHVSVARANAHVTYPAKFQLIAAMNPCPCGYLSDPSQACRRAPLCGQDYQAKISGPIFDRIDLAVFVPEVKVADLVGDGGERESSQTVAARVADARALQKDRYIRLKAKGVHLNAHAHGQTLETVTSLEPRAKETLEKAAAHMKLSARGYHRVLRVARTLADLESCEELRATHIAEALSFRPTRVTS